jgi:hypothetical protein
MLTPVLVDIGSKLVERLVVTFDLDIPLWLNFHWNLNPFRQIQN